MHMNKITKSAVRKIVSLCDAGLCDGLGEKTGKPGTMCVEAAVNFTLYGDAGVDHPKCVDADLANFKISINDWDYWTSDKRRGKALRRIAVAQLGTNSKKFSIELFTELVILEVLKEFHESTFRAGGRKHKVTWDQLKEIMEISTGDLFELKYVVENLAPHTASANDRCRVMERCLECCVRALIRMDTPGSKYLYLAP